MKSIQRIPIRDQVYRQVLEHVVRGEVTSGERIRDTALAKQLRISRTPVRETLLRLVQEGFLENHVGRGFTVRPLELRELQEVYPILWTLESFGLTLSGPPSESDLDSMAVVNGEMVRFGEDPSRLIELDNEFHAKLLSGCENRRLVSMVTHLKRIVRRYEYAYMSHEPLIGDSIDDHDRLIDLVRTGDVSSVGRLLEEHWRRSLQVMAKRLETHDT
ncbi:GntR family transcriptional regulator [Candidatus Eisenbacteria bacterium]|uniref:GntR family transcriptional regulator n=1 Tax=Eiseniibacteriota bacterium TaxID=2212470 RepID=A0ABV6YKM0_UNCEI